MRLRTVASALKRMRAATLTQLAAELATTPRELEPLLAFWEHRGNVRRCASPQTRGCGTTCRACPLGQGPVSASSRPDPVVLEWTGE